MFGAALRREFPLTIDVSGGGPVGLMFALSLVACGVAARIRVFDARWRRDGDRIAWRDALDGNHRRRQVVTIQGNVWSALPPAVQQALFAPGDYTEIWPYSSDSPVAVGRPRNLPLRTIEDRLLALLQATPGIELVPARYDATRELARGDAPHIVAVCEGARSATREAFIERFGRARTDLYEVDGRPLEETVLGLEVETPDAVRRAGEAVLLTVAQNRYLLNPHHGHGFFNMRLSRDEAERLHAELANAEPASGPRDAVDVDALRAASLWPSIVAGLRLYRLDETTIASARLFCSTLVHRPRFVAEIVPGTWACLLGDAANAMHIWPGRGLNTGLKSALSLACCVAQVATRDGAATALRAAHFCAHEGRMQMLQAREVGNRAWQAMRMPTADGEALPLDARIARAARGQCDRAVLTVELLARIRRLRARLSGRMQALPSEDAIAARLASIDDRVLKVLVETGAWNTDAVAGPEVPTPALPLAPQPAESRRDVSRLISLTSWIGRSGFAQCASKPALNASA